MTDQPKVSVLIPAYNVESFIREFLESLVSQTLKEIEIIVVNDASPDGCHDIITEFLEDNRIVYIRKKVNEGLWKARESAYKRATGEYIINLDPDDFIDADFLEKLYAMGQSNNLDVVVGNVQTVDEKGMAFGRPVLHRVRASKVLVSEDDYRLLLGTPYASWFRLIRRALLHKAGYSYLHGELVSYAIQYHDGVRVGLVPDVAYYYRKHGSSMSNYDKSSKRMHDSGEHSWENLNGKVEFYKALPITSSAKREILNCYLFRVLYTLTMISWLEKKPAKQERSKIGRFLKRSLGIRGSTIFGNLRYFRRREKLFLVLCILGLDELIIKSLKVR